MKSTPKPVDRAEEVALFRAMILGDVLACDLGRGELATRLRAISQQRFRPPGSDTTRRYGVSTLERWYYACRNDGLAGLRPVPRSDRGHAKALTPAQQQLVLDTAEAHPDASAALILRTLVINGRIDKDQVSAPTIRRLLREHDLGGGRRRKRRERTLRRRWQVASCGFLFHADVCHGPSLAINGRHLPLRIHAILDDRSRYVVAIEACHTEREVDMLLLTARAVRLHGRPLSLYLDNGSTYSGEALATVCGRLEIQLRHARPYDPQARGKMERFWRTLREQVLDHIGECHSLHDIQVRPLTWVDRHYHITPHAGLMGKTPLEVWTTKRSGCLTPVPEDALDRALTARQRRRVRQDGTVPVGGVDWELDQRFLIGRTVTIARSLLHPTRDPWVEHQDQCYAMRVVDPIANSRRPRKVFEPRPGVDALPFDPVGALLDRTFGRTPRRDDA